MDECPVAIGMGVGVRNHMQDCKSLYVAVTIWATLVNTHTHTDTETAVDRLDYELSQLS